MEKDYRRTAWKLKDAKKTVLPLSSGDPDHVDGGTTKHQSKAWSTVTFNAHFDMVLALLIIAFFDTLFTHAPSASNEQLENGQPR